MTGPSFVINTSAPGAYAWNVNGDTSISGNVLCGGMIKFR
jgi:hypothetical protein